jgi:hypothetical protein
MRDAGSERLKRPEPYFENHHFNKKYAHAPFYPNEYYHIYNRGNNQQPIFFNHSNYIFFIQKIRDQLLPVADIIAYCLMPNHFHFIIHANEISIKERKSFGGKPMQEFTYRLGILLSSYAQAINKQTILPVPCFSKKPALKYLLKKQTAKKKATWKIAFSMCIKIKSCRIGQSS